MEEKWVITYKGNIEILNQENYIKSALCGFRPGTQIEYFRRFDINQHPYPFADEMITVTSSLKSLDCPNIHWEGMFDDCNLM